MGQHRHLEAIRALSLSVARLTGVYFPFGVHLHHCELEQMYYSILEEQVLGEAFSIISARKYFLVLPVGQARHCIDSSEGQILLPVSCEQVREARHR
jgi:hypothetical protein